MGLVAERASALGSLRVGRALSNRLLPTSGATSWGARCAFRVGTPEPHHSERSPLRIRFQENGSAVCRPHKVVASSPELVRTFEPVILVVHLYDRKEVSVKS